MHQFIKSCWWENKEFHPPTRIHRLQKEGFLINPSFIVLASILHFILYILVCNTYSLVVGQRFMVRY